MEDKNEGFTGTEVVTQLGRENTVHNKQGTTEALIRLSQHVSMIPPERRLDIAQGPIVQHGDVGNKMWSAGVTDLAASISEIAEVAKEGWRKETTNKLAMKAAAAQGTAIAINSVAETKRRSPFMAAVLGQTVTTRIAEAQSIQNATTQLYNTASEEMSKLAELPTEDAMEILAEKGEKLVAGIKDPKLRELALNNLLSHMPKLAQAHHKERYALMRTKQVENNRENILQKRIAFEHGKEVNVLPEEKIGLMKSFLEDMYKINDPLGLQQDPASIKEYRTLVHTQTAADLKNGNKTLYDAIRSIPADSPYTLTLQEREGFKEAVRVYDTNRNTMAGQVIAEAELGILSAKSPEEADAAAQIARQNLQTWGLEGTSSDLDIKNKTVRKAQLEGKLARNAGVWAKNQVDAERTALMDRYYDLPALQQAALYKTMSAEEKQYASDVQIPQFITQLTGVPLDTSKKLGLSVFTDGLEYKDAKNNDRLISPVTFAKLFVRDLADDGRPIPAVLQEFVNIQMRGMAIGKGEKGKYYTDEQRNSFRVAEVLIEGASGIELSQDERVHYEFMRGGYSANDPPEAIEALYKEYKKNKGLSEIKPDSKEGREERKHRVRNIVNNTLKTTISDRAAIKYEQEYNRILQAVGFNKKVAKAAFTKKVRHNSSVVLGLKVDNGRELDKELGEYGLETILNTMGTIDKKTKYGEAISLGSPALMTIFGTERDKDQKLLTDPSRLQLINIEYINDDDSVVFTTINGGVTRIPLDHLKDTSAKMRVHKLKTDFIKANDVIMKYQGVSNSFSSPLAGEVLREVYDRDVSSKSDNWLIRKLHELLD